MLSADGDPPAGGPVLTYDQVTEELHALDRDLRADEDRCEHGVTFDAEAAKGLSADEVRRRWPRLRGLCPKGCGFNGFAYASLVHFGMGDW